MTQSKPGRAHPARRCRLFVPALLLGGSGAAPGSKWDVDFRVVRDVQ